MPDKTYTSEDIALLLEHMKGKNDPKDNVTYAPEQIDALVRSAINRQQMATEPGEQVMQQGVQGLPQGSRVVSAPTQIFEPRQAPQPSFEIGQGEMIPGRPQRDAIAQHQALGEQFPELTHKMKEAMAQGNSQRYEQLDAVRRGNMGSYLSLARPQPTLEIGQVEMVPSTHSKQMDSVRHSDAMWEQKQRAKQRPPSTLDWLMARGRK